MKILTCIPSLNKNFLKSSSDDGSVVNDIEETVLKCNMRNPLGKNNQRSFLDLMMSSKNFDYQKIIHVHKIPNPK